MPVTFPNISFNRVACYPLQGSTKWTTQVLRYLNDEEQRFVKYLPRQEFQLTYSGVDQGSFITLRTFWESMHGADISTFSLDLGIDAGTGVHMLYPSLLFVDDEFTAVQSKPNRWDIKLRVRASQ